MKCFSYPFILIILLTLTSTYAQQNELTYSQTYLLGYPKLLTALPTVENWNVDNTCITQEGDVIKIVNLLSGAETVLLDYNLLNENLPEDVNLSSSEEHTTDYTKFVLLHQDDLYLYTLEDKTFSKLTNDRDEEKNPTFSPDGNLIAYTKNHDLFVYDLIEKKEFQLTYDGSDAVYSGYASWIYYEEILGRSSNYRAFYWSPDSKQIAFLHFDDTLVPTFTLFNADGVHGELEVAHYPKPGDPIPTVKLGVININSKKTSWIDSTDKKRDYIAWPIFTNDSKGLLYQKMNRGQDTLQIMIAGLNDPRPKEIYKETQTTWVEFFKDIYILQNSEGILFRSEVDDWYHIYHYNLDGKLIQKITKGDWSVADIEFIDEEKGVIYFHAGIEKSTEKHLYITDFDGIEISKLTVGEGTHTCNVIQNGKYFFDKYSSITEPTKLDFYDLVNNNRKTIADSKLPEMNNYALAKVELFTIPTEDGYNLPAKWFLPPNFDETKKYPVIFSVYGGPSRTSVTNSFPRRGLGSYYLAQNGIIVIQVDNRGSGHFGKKGKDEMHRNLGVWEIDDLVCAVKWLIEKPFINKDKIAITGGSYGGYTTAMALTRASEYFKFGIAKYSVTDWRLYDNFYTERFMDTPEENPKGYKYGSVMTHAAQYNGGLLLTHGSMDDNVHMQNTIQLIDQLQSFDKEFELMIYPNQRHGIRYPKYPHSKKLEMNFWFKNLLGKRFFEK